MRKNFFNTYKRNPSVYIAMILNGIWNTSCVPKGAVTFSSGSEAASSSSSSSSQTQGIQPEMEKLKVLEAEFQKDLNRLGMDACAIEWVLDLVEDNSKHAISRLRDAEKTFQEMTASMNGRHDLLLRLSDEMRCYDSMTREDAKNRVQYEWVIALWGVHRDFLLNCVKAFDFLAKKMKSMYIEQNQTISDETIKCAVNTGKEILRIMDNSVTLDGMSLSYKLPLDQKSLAMFKENLRECSLALDTKIREFTP